MILSKLALQPQNTSQAGNAFGERSNHNLLMKTIPLTQDKIALIDDEDFEVVSSYKWHAYCARNKQSRGEPPWYAVAYINGRRTSLHRFLMAAGSGQIVDHEDRNGLNNQRGNLRFVSSSRNQANSAGKVSTRISSFKGVSRVKRKNGFRWRAQIALDGRDVHLGYYNTELAAAQAYDFAASWCFGRYARFNTLDASV